MSTDQKNHSISQTSMVIYLGLIVVGLLAKMTPYILSYWGLELDPGRSTYPWNFSPLLPIALISGACFLPRWGLLIPLAAWFMADLSILLVTGRVDWAFYPHQWVVYLSVMLVIGSGYAVQWLRRTNQGTPSLVLLLGSGILGATLFYLVTNFAVWYYGNEFLYPLTASGLVECYVNAIPFYRNSVVSMAIYVPLLAQFFDIRVAEYETAGHAIHSVENS